MIAVGVLFINFFLRATIVAGLVSRTCERIGTALRGQEWAESPFRHCFGREDMVQAG